jgi:gliding motility-associated-like protein
MIEYTMRRMFQVCATTITLLLLAATLPARHIIGGVITYECLGDGNYEFTMKLYRDCNCTECADFDRPAFIAIYRCTGEDCRSLRQTNFLHRLDVPIQSITRVDAPDYPCLIPPNICVQEGIYRFRLSDYGIRLPVSEDSYHISYQRCCRNITINNIVRPDNTGATYTIEITPEGQQVCNNSPVFDDFPPTVICANAPLNFDHSATDKDGDQLVYEFCPPLAGGGPGLSNFEYLTCTGAQPSPACPPPYNPVTFILPTYTPARPMGGDPVVRIDPNTGIIFGTPRVLGQFVVGVCVKEYRDGVLLSTVFRDFQFNVASCEPTVVASILEDRKIDDRKFVVNSCGDLTINFVNQSFQRQFISYYEWRFNINGATEIFRDWSPSITFPGVGVYEGQLILNPNTECGDTAEIFVNLFPAIEADFEFQYDTCVAGPVQFTDRSQTGAQRITDWDWSLGDGSDAIIQNPRHTYGLPGDFPVNLRVIDNNECQDDITKIVEYFPAPALVIVEPSAFRGCAPQDIFFNNLSTPIDETYTVRWNFGDGGTSADISPWHRYENPGIFDVSVTITSPIGCQTEASFNNLIRMEESPEAGFSFRPDQPSNLNPEVTFFDESQRAASWFWDFGTGFTTTQRNPIYSFPDTGLYLVKQIVIHPNGCQDTISRLIDVIPEIHYYLPNAFTPNSDAVNDIFKGAGFLVGATNFNMSIWNRWGEMIFQTNNPEEGWNGRKFNAGAESPNGVYVVLVTFVGPRGKRYEFKGFAALIR